MLPVIKIENTITDVCPGIKIGVIRADVTNIATPEGLWNKISDACSEIKRQYSLLEINKRPAIAATRTLYRHNGKDPNRYRVASEALCRRAVKGLQLHRINALVDLINLLSIISGYPVSGLDANKIEGDSLTLGIGRHGEHFEGIGRGMLNIEGLPVYRDLRGGIATPTSDEERTKIDLSTTKVHININAFAPEMPLPDTMKWCCEMLQEYCMAKNIETTIIN